MRPNARDELLTAAAVMRVQETTEWAHRVSELLDHAGEVRRRFEDTAGQLQYRAMTVSDHYLVAIARAYLASIQ